MTKFITWSSDHTGNCLCFLLVFLSRAFLRISTKYWIDSRPNWKALHQWIGRDQFLVVGTFFHVFEATVSPPFCLFYKRFPLLSDLIDLTRWVKINTYFIPRLRLIMLSGTGSNRGTKCIPRLARFNPRLALIGFSGTRARRLNSPVRQ